MKIQIFQGTTENDLYFKKLPIVNKPHNIRYSHTNKNCLFFQVLRFPYKDMLRDVAYSETGTVKFQQSYIRACVKTTETVLCFVFRYKVENVERKKSNELDRKSVVEKERVYLIDADKEEIVQLVDPVAVELMNCNYHRDGKFYTEWYNDWAHPVIFEDVVSKLTQEQKKKAAKVLKEMFIDSPAEDQKEIPAC